MFLLLEDNDVIRMDYVVALVRSEGRTTITLGDNSVKESVFTPATLDRRSSRFTRGTADRTGGTRTIGTEDK